MEIATLLFFVFFAVALTSQVNTSGKTYQLNQNGEYILLFGLVVIAVVVSTNVSTCGKAICTPKEGFDPVEVSPATDDMYYGNLVNTYAKLRRSQNCRELLDTLTDFDHKLYANDAEYLRYLYERNKDQMISDMYSYAHEKMSRCNELQLPHYQPAPAPRNLQNVLNRPPYEETSLFSHL